MELRESLEDTARREVLEEINLVCGDLQLLNVYSGPELYHKYPDGNEVYNVTAAYICHNFSGELKVEKSEGRAAKFYHINKLPTNLSSSIKPILKDYLKRFQCVK